MTFTCALLQTGTISARSGAGTLVRAAGPALGIFAAGTQSRCFVARSTLPAAGALSAFVVNLVQSDSQACAAQRL